MDLSGLPTWGIGLLLGLNLSPVLALPQALGENGTDTAGLERSPWNLTGKDVWIGQLELSRPRKFGFDRPLNSLEKSQVDPAQVFFRDRSATPNRHLDEHSHQVAAVMISRDRLYRGVAPAANLIASAYADRGQGGQLEALVAAQHLLKQGNSLVRAVNLSFGEPLAAQADLDGGSWLSLGLDWLAYTYNSLLVVSGNQAKGGIPVPTDLFNGLVVGFTRQDRDQVYRILDRNNLIDEPFVDRNFNHRYDPGEIFTDLNQDGRWTAKVESPKDGRRSLALLAPGADLQVPRPDGKIGTTRGTSFAAPLVTGTVALLQEYADRLIRANRWSMDARRPEVIKATLLNSADKIQDQGDGQNLGMTKTIYDWRGKTWLDCDAYQDRALPLCDFLGAGQLNTRRALQQFAAGQQSPGVVRALGWNYGAIQPRQVHDYYFDRPLVGGSLVVATLSWQRRVVLKDSNGDRAFNQGESFRAAPINHLYLYLMAADQPDSEQNIWSSVSAVDNLQHLALRIPHTGRYKLRTVFHRQQDQDLQLYAIAWWAKTER
ncbi:MAG: S8 family serine peptidase [Pseudanabaenaceae cyanobacterium bins.68]|nr:S8 family serine peptidase [Pseudanabaenaceae cyanobacterium bins.68]